MTFNEHEVLRDALCEFITARNCDPLDEQDDETHLSEYMQKRYPSLFASQSARRLKLTTLRIRIQTARKLLTQLQEIPTWTNSSTDSACGSSSDESPRPKHIALSSRNN